MARLASYRSCRPHEELEGGTITRSKASVNPNYDYSISSYVPGAIGKSEQASR